MFPSKMVIFHCYVSSPEGIRYMSMNIYICVCVYICRHLFGLDNYTCFCNLFLLQKVTVLCFFFSLGCQKKHLQIRREYLCTQCACTLACQINLYIMYIYTPAPHAHIYIYIAHTYIYMCVCVCVYIYIYTHITYVYIYN